MDDLDLSSLGEIETISLRTGEILAGVKRADGTPDEEQLAAIGEARAHVDVAIANLVALAAYLTARLDAAVPAPE